MNKSCEIFSLRKLSLTFLQQLLKVFFSNEFKIFKTFNKNIKILEFQYLHKSKTMTIFQLWRPGARSHLSNIHTSVHSDTQYFKNNFKILPSKCFPFFYVALNLHRSTFKSCAFVASNKLNSLSYKHDSLVPYKNNFFSQI